MSKNRQWIVLSLLLILLGGLMIAYKVVRLGYPLQPDQTSEPLMRITKDERYRVLEERDGWYRIATEMKGVSPWVPASAVRTAKEAATSAEHILEALSSQ